MPHYSETLRLSAQELHPALLVNTHECSGTDEDPTFNMVLTGPFIVEYPSGFTIELAVLNRPHGMVQALLKSTHGRVVDRIEDVGRSLERDYELHWQDYRYTLCIKRVTIGTLTSANANMYNTIGGVLCPFCGSDDLFTGTMQLREPSPGRAKQDVKCCACRACWEDLYVLEGINQEADTWEPPAEADTVIMD